MKNPMEMNEQEMQEWVKIQRDYLDSQAPLRAAWLDETLPEEARKEAHQKLHALVEEVKEKCPPITGTFTYTDEDVKEAKRHGF